jgi:autotransporter translocation and assembly factor TamB
MIRVIKWTLSTILLLPVLLIAVVLVALNVAPGQRWVESEVKSLTGGMVMLEGLGGVFPMAPRLARFELNDATGAWLVVQDLALDWSPLDLLHGDAHVDRAILLSRDCRNRQVRRRPLAVGSACRYGSILISWRLGGFRWRRQWLARRPC